MCLGSGHGPPKIGRILRASPPEHAGAGPVRDRLVPPLLPGGYREGSVRFGSPATTTSAGLAAGLVAGAAGQRAPPPGAAGSVPFTPPVRPVMPRPGPDPWARRR